MCLGGLWIVKIIWVVKELAHNKGNLFQQRELQLTGDKVFYFCEKKCKYQYCDQVPTLEVLGADTSVAERQV